jgi:plastocyanin
MVFAVNPAGKFDIFLNNAKNTNPENPTQVTAGAISQTASAATVTVTEDCSVSTTVCPTESRGSGYGTSTAVSAGATHSVVVGGPAGLVYTPEFVNAAVGDVVKFDFRAMNHTATQSSFNLPCIALPGGAKSGFRPNLANTPGVQIFEFTVPTDKPQWFYCGQADHCEKGEFLHWIFCVASQWLTCL